MNEDLKMIIEHSKKSIKKLLKQYEETEPESMIERIQILGELRMTIEQFMEILEKAK